MIEAHPSSDPASPWYYGTLIKERKSGWFPSSYVAEVQDGASSSLCSQVYASQRLTSLATSLSVSLVVQAKALYSYTGSSDQEMPFVEGDVLTIVEHTNESWWKAVSDGIVFLVPAAYLELQGQSLSASPPFAQSPLLRPTPLFTPLVRSFCASQAEPHLAFSSLLPCHRPENQNDRLYGPTSNAKEGATAKGSCMADASIDPPESAVAVAEDSTRRADRPVSLVVTSPAEDNPLSEETSAANDVSLPMGRTRSGSTVSSIGERRRAPPRPPVQQTSSHRLSIHSPSGEIILQEGMISDEDEDSSLSDNEGGEDPDSEDGQKREAERLRVLEAAGLRITTDPTTVGRPRPSRRRKPPAAPARRPQSMISEGETSRPRPDSMVSISSLPPSPAPESTPRLEDAYDRYEAMMTAQKVNPGASQTSPIEPALPSLPEDTPSPTTPTSPTPSSSTTVGGREGRLSQMMAKITASVAPLAPEPKRLSISSISGPSRQANNTSPATVTRASTPAAESTVRPTVDCSVLVLY